MDVVVLRDVNIIEGHGYLVKPAWFYVIFMRAPVVHKTAVEENGFSFDKVYYVHTILKLSTLPFYIDATTQAYLQKYVVASSRMRIIAMKDYEHENVTASYTGKTIMLNKTVPSEPSKRSTLLFLLKL